VSKWNCCAIIGVRISITVAVAVVAVVVVVVDDVVIRVVAAVVVATVPAQGIARSGRHMLRLRERRLGLGCGGNGRYKTRNSVLLVIGYCTTIKGYGVIGDSVGILRQGGLKSVG